MLVGVRSVESLGKTCTHMAKSLHNEALGKSGNKCLLRRFEASPTHLISIINVKLSHVFIYVCKLDTLRVVRWRTNVHGRHEIDGEIERRLEREKILGSSPGVLRGGRKAH